MKIAWFTPFVKTSAIGKISALICEELSRGHEVHVWTSDQEELHEVSVPVRTFSPGFSGTELAEYDEVIYNLGNFARFHKDIYDISQKIPGIVILHDQTMADYWGECFFSPEYGGGGDAGISLYQNIARRCYGVEADEAIYSEQGLVHPALTGYSFLEPTIQGAKGIFTHASFFAKRLRSITNLPVEYSYLPCRIPGEADRRESGLTELIRAARTEKRKIAVSTGRVYPTKQIDVLVQILLDDPALARKICYLVVGGYDGEYGEKLKMLSEGELKGCLHMLGYQPDEAMEEALRAADLAVNLRYPNTEVCSLSLWEQMAAGKAVLVFDSGVYGEIPGDVVLRVPRREKEKAIKSVLWDLAEDRIDPDIGRRAGEFIRRRCNVSVYCETLLGFIDKIRLDKPVAELQDRTIAHVGGILAELRINEKTVPASYAAAIDNLAAILGGPLETASNKTLGIWIGFPNSVPSLHREGNSRAIDYLVSSLLHYHSDVNVEVWSYSFNAEEVALTFSSVQAEDRSRIQFITEKNWSEELEATAAQRAAAGEINEIEDTLVRAVRIASRASVFIPIILHLDRIAEAGKKLFVPGYDVAMAEHYGEFIEKDPLNAARNLDYIWRAENLAGHGADFFCNSDTVRRTEILKYIPNLKEDRTHVVYLPPNIPECGVRNLMDEDTLRSRFAIKGRYLFYPTQIRPYKNVGTLVRAFALLMPEHPDLRLVLTGNPEHLPEVDRLMKDTGISSRTVLLKDVSEIELYSLYRYAAAVPAASYFEAGFHYQAMEGLLMKAPVAIADIPVVRERIASLGYDVENCGIPLFDPTDAEALADILDGFLRDRGSAVARQRGFAEKLLSYTWEDAADQYYKLFFDRKD